MEKCLIKLRIRQIKHFFLFYNLISNYAWQLILKSQLNNIKMHEDTGALVTSISKSIWIITECSQVVFT